MYHTNDFSGQSFWQSETWSQILIQSGQALHVEYFTHKDEVTLIEFRTIGLGLIGAFSIGVSQPCSDPLWYSIGRSIAEQHGAIYWQIEYLGDMQFPCDQQYLEPYKHFLEPYTQMLDLSIEQGVLLSNMHEKCRYNIGLSRRRGVDIREIEPSSEAIDIWMSLITETTLRDRFAHNSRRYYEQFLSHRESVRLYFAYFSGKVTAAAIIVYHGDMAIYYYGASTSDPELRRHLSPYLLQWHIITEAQSAGYRQYDFLGIAPPDTIGHRLEGVTDFKKRFGGKMVRLGQKVLFPLSWKYHGFALIQRILGKKKG